MVDLKPFETITFRTMGEDLSEAQRNFLGLVFSHTVEAPPEDNVEVAHREGKYALAAHVELLPVDVVEFKVITFLNQLEEGIGFSTHAYANLLRAKAAGKLVGEYSVVTGPSKADSEGAYVGLGLGGEESAKIDDAELQRFVDTVTRLEEAGDLTPLTQPR